MTGKVSTTQGSRPARRHALEGRGVHRREAGMVRWQGVVLAVFPGGGTGESLALIQFFEWGWGGKSTQHLFRLAELCSDDWAFYDTVEEMNEHYERVDRPAKQWANT